MRRYKTGWTWKWQVVALLVVLAAAVGVACAGPKPTPTPTAAPVASPTPVAKATPTATPVTTGPKYLAPVNPPAPFPEPGQYGGVLNDLVKFASPPHFDCMLYCVEFQDQTFHAYNRLVRVDPMDLNVMKPELAKRWEVSTDWLTYTFYLEEGVKFHDGEVMHADDVVYSLNRVITPPKGTTSNLKAIMAPVESITTPDPNGYVVVIKLKRPAVDFLFDMGAQSNIVYPKHLIELWDNAGKGYWTEIVGTGPFKLVEHKVEQTYTYEKFKDYFRKGLPYLDGVKGFHIPDPSEAAHYAAFQAGRIDVLHQFEDPKGAEFINTQMKGKAVAYFVRGPRVFSWMMNFKPPGAKEHWKDIRVRKALALSIDKVRFAQATGKVVQYQLNGGALLPGHPWALSNEELAKIPGYDFTATRNAGADCEEARRLLTEAGYKIPLEVNAMVLQSGSYFIDTAIIAAGVWGECGVFRMNLEQVEYVAWLERFQGGKFDTLDSSAGLKFFSVSGMMGEYASSAGARNYGHWADAELDALFAKQSQEADPAKRAELVKQYQREFLNRYYIIPMAWGGQYRAWWNYVHNFWTTPDRYSRELWEDVWVNPGKKL